MLVAALVEPREVRILPRVVGQIVTVTTSEEILSLVVVVERRACVACVTAVETFVPAPPRTTVKPPVVVLSALANVGQATVHTSPPPVRAPLSVALRLAPSPCLPRRVTA